MHCYDPRNECAVSEPSYSCISHGEAEKLKTQGVHMKSESTKINVNFRRLPVVGIPILNYPDYLSL